jgi:N-methylhydantoinase A
VEHGLLRVGPESAGARPGPVCYGRGGTLATVTDADVVLGIISPDNFLGGRMKLDLAGATEAIRTQVAEPLGVSVEEAAAGIRQVVDGHMADTLREVSIGRGYDPRDFSIFAYGGAGPAHCASYGAELGVARVIIPATSMAHSAFGALAADIHQTAERSRMMTGGGGDRDPWAGFDAGEIGAMFAELEEQALTAIAKAGIRRDEAILTRSVDMRYRRQTHDLIIPVPGGAIGDATIQAVVEDFERTYEAVYGKGAGFRLAGIALSTFRVSAVGRTKKPTLRGPDVADVPKARTRRIFEPHERRFAEATVWDWLALPVGHRIPGPAVIEHPETTVYVAPGQTAEIDAVGNLSIELEQRA